LSILNLGESIGIDYEMNRIVFLIKIQ
jgi:hypothetical protein